MRHRFEAGSVDCDRHRHLGDRGRGSISVSLCVFMGLFGVLLAGPAASQLGRRPDAVPIYFEGVVLGELGPFDNGAIDIVAVLREGELEPSSEGGPGPLDEALYSIDALAGLTRSRLRHEEVNVEIAVLTAQESAFTWPEIDAEINCMEGSIQENSHLATDWCPGGTGMVWLLGPGGEVLGRYDLAQSNILHRRAGELAKALKDARPSAIVKAARGAEGSWRLGFLHDKLGAVHFSREGAKGVLDEWPRVAPTISNGMKDGPFRSAEVPLALHALLMNASGESAPRAPWRDHRKVLSRSPELTLLSHWLDAQDGTSKPAAYPRKLRGMRRRAATEALVAARRLRLRDHGTLGFALGWVDKSRPKEWQVRAAALDLLADRGSPGFGSEGPFVLDEKFLSRDHRADSWQCRQAWTRLLGTVPRRRACDLLIQIAEGDEHPWVRKSAIEQLVIATGVDFGRSLATYRRWIEDQGEDWVPRGGVGSRLIPPKPSYVKGENGMWLLSNGLAVGDSVSKRIFATSAKRVVYVLDRSVSMAYGYNHGVARELARELEAAPAGREVGLVTYAEEADVAGTSRKAPKLRPVTEGFSKLAVESYKGSVWDGKTNFEAALRQAFQYEGVEEIVLLSDGRATHGSRQSAESLLALLEELNCVRRVRISTVLMCTGNSYLVEDLGGKPMPRATDDEVRQWRLERAPAIKSTPAYRLLSRLAIAYGGTCRIGFANRLFSRNGVPIDD